MSGTKNKLAVTPYGKPYRKPYGNYVNPYRITQMSNTKKQKKPYGIRVFAYGNALR